MMTVDSEPTGDGELEMGGGAERRNRDVWAKGRRAGQ